MVPLLLTTTKETTMKFNTILLSLLSITLVGVGVSNLPTVAEARGAAIRGADAVSRAVFSETEAPAAKPEKVEGEFGTPAPNGGTYLSPGVGNPAGEITSEIKPVNLPGETMIEIGVGNQPVVPEPAPQVEETPDDETEANEPSEEEKALLEMRSNRMWLGLAENLDAVARKAEKLKIPYIGKFRQAHFNGMGTEFEQGLAGLEAASKLRGAARIARKLHELDPNSAQFERVYRTFLSSAFGPNWNQSSVQATQDALVAYMVLGPDHGFFNDFLDQQITTLDVCID